MGVEKPLHGQPRWQSPTVLVPRTVRMLGEQVGKAHSGIEGEEMTAARLAEYKKIKAELREARTGDRFQRQSGGLSAVAGIPAKSTIRVHPSVEEGNHPGTCVMCRCLVVSHSGLLHPGGTGACRKPASAVEELANFCDVSSSHELRTNPAAVDGVAKSWNAGGVAISPRGRCAGSCSLEGLEGVSHPAPRPTTTVPAADPWRGVPI